jgi:single-strand DNA-binding protein
MLNQVVLVGRLAKEPEMKETESGKKVTNITIAVPRNYKNSVGEYDTDFINCTLWNGVAENTAEYCKKGDMVGIKGRLELQNYEKDNQKVSRLAVQAERLTFLAQQKENSEKNKEEQER